MTRRDRRRSRALARHAGEASTPQATTHPRLSITFSCADRRALLLGTALASTLLLASVTAPTPAHAVVTCPPGTFPPPGPITLNPAGDSVNCVNTYDRNNAGAPVIDLQTYGAGRFITLDNSGNLTSPDNRGIRAYSHNLNSPVSVINTGDIDSYRAGIYAKARFGTLDVFNSGHITGLYAGIQAATGTGGGPNSPLSLTNTGDIDLQQGTAISANTYQAQSKLSVVNSGALTGANYAIVAGTGANDSPLSVTNSGALWANSSYPANAVGIGTYTGGTNSPTTITNSAPVWAVSSRNAYGIRAFGYGSPITIHNSGDFRATTTGAGYDAFGIDVITVGTSSAITINNSGSVFAQGPASSRVGGVYVSSPSGATIVNSGDIGASSNLAILSTEGPVDIFNTGTITGFVRLDADDRFVNQAGGVFEARGTSNFDAYGAGGNDLFLNQAGGTVHAAGSANTPETTRFVNLERFENKGLISTVDGGTGDSFTISNTPGGTDLNFKGSGSSTLAVDAFLGGPGSKADNFIVEGNVSGTTTVAINNTNTGPGVFNSTGIPVVFVTGKTPKESNFQLAQPIDTGFFDYDLFFTPTGSGFWDLKSYPGAGAHLLPQLVTAAQDIWHQGASTWFDRTADLRVLLAGGAAPAAAGYGAAVPTGNFTPATWVRGSGSWLDRNDSAKTSAYGRTYKYNLDRELDTMDFQMGIDLGKRDFLSQGDILVFGMLGGFVHGNLDYDKILRNFDFDGGQVGAYATYLKGGLFVDTLLNVHLLEMDANHALGFPSETNVSTVGLRTDSGYRFGSFNGGAFIEPLATIEVTWADIDGFNLGGNKVSFDDDANVRGRLGLRAGTTMNAWEGTMMEPFVTGSLWGNLSGDNQATLVSSGSTFRFEDRLEDVWGEVSAGVNFFNLSATTSVFAKADVTFGQDVTGLGGKAGMRVSW